MTVGRRGRFWMTPATILATMSNQRLDQDLKYCDEHRELADLLIEHGCAPAGEDRELFRALVRRDNDRFSSLSVRLRVVEELISDENQGEDQ
jgi:hypothetical protein